MKKFLLAILAAVSFVAFAEGEAPKAEAPKADAPAAAEAPKAAPAKKEKKKKKVHTPATHNPNKAEDAAEEAGKSAH